MIREYLALCEETSSKNHSQETVASIKDQFIKTHFAPIIVQTANKLVNCFVGYANSIIIDLLPNTKQLWHNIKQQLKFQQIHYVVLYINYSGHACDYGKWALGSGDSVPFNLLMNKVGTFTVDKRELSVHIINDCCYSGRFIQEAIKFITAGKQKPNLKLLTIETACTGDTTIHWKKFREFKQMLKNSNLTKDQKDVAERIFRR